MKQYDILLIGGGVIGLSIAFELSKTATRNGLRIGVMEKEQAGPSASWAAAGMIPPAPTKQLNDPIDKLKNISCNEWESWRMRSKNHLALMSSTEKRAPFIWLGLPERLHRSLASRISIRNKACELRCLVSMS